MPVVGEHAWEKIGVKGQPGRLDEPRTNVATHTSSTHQSTHPRTYTHTLTHTHPRAHAKTCKVGLPACAPRDDRNAMWCRRWRRATACGVTLGLGGRHLGCDFQVLPSQEAAFFYPYLVLGEGGGIASECKGSYTPINVPPVPAVFPEFSSHGTDKSEIQVRGEKIRDFRASARESAANAILDGMQNWSGDFLDQPILREPQCKTTSR